MATNKKYVVKKAMHLGHIRTGVAVGDTIEHDEEHNTLVINGKVYETTKDLEILKKHNWVAPFENKKAREEALSERAEIDKKYEQEQKEQAEKSQKERNLPIVRSDDDAFDTIDISHTRKKAKEVKPKKDKMDIIKGDQDPDEIIARKETEIKPMPIVHEDSLGDDIEQPALNAGMIKKISPEQHEKLRQEAQEKAKKGFVDPRIAKAKEAVDSVKPAKAEVKEAVKVEVTEPVKRGRGRPPKVKGTVESIVSGTGPKMPSLES